MAHGDQLTVFLCGHNAGHLRHRQDIALVDVAFLDFIHGGLRHMNRCRSAGNPVCLRLFTDIHHVGASLFIKMGQLHRRSPSYLKHIAMGLRFTGFIHVMSFRLHKNALTDGILQRFTSKPTQRNFCVRVQAGL